MLDEGSARLLNHFLVHLWGSFTLFTQQLPCLVLLVLEIRLRHLGCYLRAGFVRRAQDVASIESIVRLRSVIIVLPSRCCCCCNSPRLSPGLHECDKLSCMHLGYLVHAEQLLPFTLTHLCCALLLICLNAIRGAFRRDGVRGSGLGSYLLCSLAISLFHCVGFLSIREQLLVLATL